MDGVAGDHLLLAPPFILAESQVDDLLAVLGEGISAVEKALPVVFRG
ncbi:MAG: hypothetical protein HYU32_05355 [candidate division NC10 bacterium]|nr:hypothetical protein [candidate division NC10 bacterium]MBI2163552.1 hypothetical protein [candidate division NC10 bacterium]